MLFFLPSLNVYWPETLTRISIYVSLYIFNYVFDITLEKTTSTFKLNVLKTGMEFIIFDWKRFQLFFTVYISSCVSQKPLTFCKPPFSPSPVLSISQKVLISSSLPLQPQFQFIISYLKYLNSFLNCLLDFHLGTFRSDCIPSVLKTLKRCSINLLCTIIISGMAHSGHTSCICPPFLWACHTPFLHSLQKCSLCLEFSSQMYFLIILHILNQWSIFSLSPQHRQGQISVLYLLLYITSS